MKEHRRSVENEMMIICGVMSMIGFVLTLVIMFVAPPVPFWFEIGLYCAVGTGATAMMSLFFALLDYLRQ